MAKEPGEEPPSHPSAPSPEEFQKKLEEMLKKHPGFVTVEVPQGFQSKPQSSGGEQEEQKEPPKLEFDYKPRDVKAHLDRFVIRQDEAKKVLSVALCDHYNHVRLALEGKPQTNYTKQNVILLGPTGVGKTYLIRSVAELIGVPFVKADATKFSETGYVGSDVEDMVRELVRRADGDVKRAECGIIYIDEIDKLASATEGRVGRDVSGRGVQTNLLKLMEETEVPARSPNDIAGQMAAMMEASQGRPPGPSTVNTRHILFVVSGAFDGLEKIVRHRIREATIGFAAPSEVIEEADEIFEQAQTRDFIDFGFEPEFIGRLPVRVVCHSLSTEDLYDILKDSEGSIIRQYEEDFACYGVEVLFKDDGLRRIAEQAQKEKTGARGLMTVCERTFRNFKFELPSTDVKHFTVTEALVDAPSAAFDQLLTEHEREARTVMEHLIREFGERFRKTHGLEIVFTDEAVEKIIEEAVREHRSVRDLCAEKFKDFQFGLKLIAKNKGKRKFVIESDTVDAPDKTLSEWVVESYRNVESAAGAKAEDSTRDS